MMGCPARQRVIEGDDDLCRRPPVEIQAWQRLPLLGAQDDGAGGWLELRNCSCGTTLCRELEPPEPTIEFPPTLKTVSFDGIERTMWRAYDNVGDRIGHYGTRAEAVAASVEIGKQTP